MKKCAEQAAACFMDGFNCTQAVFATCAERLGLDREIAFKIACGFGSGMGGLQQTCGAVTGAFMAIGLKNGKSRQDEDDKKQQTYSLVKQFAADFIKANGSLGCSELIGCDLGTAEGKTYAKEHDLFRTKCLGFVKDAAAITGRLLDLS